MTSEVRRRKKTARLSLITVLDVFDLHLKLLRRRSYQGPYRYSRCYIMSFRWERAPNLPCTLRRGVFREHLSRQSPSEPGISGSLDTFQIHSDSRFQFARNVMCRTRTRKGWKRVVRNSKHDGKNAMAIVNGTKLLGQTN